MSRTYVIRAVHPLAESGINNQVVLERALHTPYSTRAAPDDHPPTGLRCGASRRSVTARAARTTISAAHSHQLLLRWYRCERRAAESQSLLWPNQMQVVTGRRILVALLCLLALAATAGAWSATSAGELAESLAFGARADLAQVKAQLERMHRMLDRDHTTLLSEIGKARMEVILAGLRHPPSPPPLTPLPPLPPHRPELSSHRHRHRHGRMTHP
eukprot:5705784-Prymnesium_polylepis.1